MQGHAFLQGKYICNIKIVFSGISKSIVQVINLNCFQQVFKAYENLGKKVGSLFYRAFIDDFLCNPMYIEDNYKFYIP